MKEKQEIRRIEIGIIQLVVVLFVAWVTSKLPYTEITKGSVVLLGIVHVVTYYISNYFENLKYRGYLLLLSNIVSYLLQSQPSFPFLQMVIFQFHVADSFILSSLQVLSYT